MRMRVRILIRMEMVFLSKRCECMLSYAVFLHGISLMRLQYSLHYTAIHITYAVTLTTEQADRNQG